MEESNLIIALLMNHTTSLRIWLILIQDRFGRPAALLCNVSGKPARGSWRVKATAMTVPERSLKTSWLKISTGRRLACSRPRTGFRSAQRISPLSIRATFPGFRRDPFRRGLLFFRIELGALPGQPGAGYSLEFLGERGFDGLAPIPEALMSDQLVDADHQLGFEGQCNFRLRHGKSWYDKLSYHRNGGLTLLYY